MMKRLSVVAGIIGAAAVPIALSATARADADLLSTAGVLSDSTNAMFVGGTFEPTPSLAYVEAAESLYLDPLGFSGAAASASTVCDMVGSMPCEAPLQVLTTPELLEEGPSTLETEKDIISGVQAQFADGHMSATDPLTVFAYSQSAMAASAAEQTLINDGIPTADLKFVFIGDPSTPEGVAPNIYADLTQLFGGGTTGTQITDALLKFVNEDQFAPSGPLAGVTPNNLYETTIYTIHTDGVADWQEDWNAGLAADHGNAFGALGNALSHVFTTHLEYLGLTPAEVATGVSSTDNMTTTITIPDGTDPGSIINDSTALLNSFSHGALDSGFLTSLAQSLQDLFNPAYA